MPRKSGAWAALATLICLLTAGQAWSMCGPFSGVGSWTDISANFTQSVPDLVKVYADYSEHPIHPDGCWSGQSWSWSFSFKLENDSLNLPIQADILLSSLLVTFLDSNDDVLGSKVIVGADLVNWFTDGNFTTIGSALILRADDDGSGEWCSTCFCAHLGGEIQGKVLFTLTYLLDEGDGAFSLDQIPQTATFSLPPDPPDPPSSGRIILHPQSTAVGIPSTTAGVGGAGPAFFQYYAPVSAGQDALEVTLTGISDDGLDLYVRKGDAPTLADYDYKSVGSHERQQVVVLSPDAGDWYFGVYASGASNTANLNVSYTSLTELTSGAGEDTGGVNQNWTNYYYIEVPANQDYLDFTITSPDGTVYLYAKNGGLPYYHGGVYDFASENPCGAEQEISLTAANAALDGTWYIGVYCPSSTAGGTLTATYGFFNYLTYQDQEDFLSPNTGEWAYRRIACPAGASELRAVLVNEYGGPKFVLKEGAPPISDDLSCDDYICKALNPDSASTWYLGVYASSTGENGYAAWLAFGVAGTAHNDDAHALELSCNCDMPRPEGPSGSPEIRPY